MRASPLIIMLQLRRTFALVPTLPLFARAQSPRITPQEDPSVTAEYRRSGAELTVRHRIAGAGSVQPPEKIRDLIDWLRAVSQDDARMIVLEKPKTALSPTP